MEGHRCTSPVFMTVLLVRASLPHLLKSKTLKDSNNFSWLEDLGYAHNQATTTFCVPMNSPSNLGSPSSSSISMTSLRFSFNSSSVSACECAPGNPGTKPTYSPVSEHFSITAVKVFL